MAKVCETCGRPEGYHLCSACGWKAKCVTGCKSFAGGEKLHHKDCSFYPDSLSELHDYYKMRNEEYRNVLSYLLQLGTSSIVYHTLDDDDIALIEEVLT